MAGKRSNIICPKCKKTGGFLQKRWVKRTVNLPKANKITNISEAWDHAAKACLRTRENMILLFHPSPPDDKFNWYDMFSKFSPHTDQEIKAFELRHLSTPSKNIKTKKTQLSYQIRRTTEAEAGDYTSNKLHERNTKHIKLPKDAGRITKSSISFLYGAIICLVLRDISYNFPLPEETNKKFAYAIYTYFSIMEIDLRHARTWLAWFDIFQDVHNHGYHAAASINAAKTMYCKNCSNIKKDILVSMEIVKETPNQLKCPQCGSRESLKRRLTTKHLRNINDQVLQKAVDLSNYFSLFQQIQSMYNNIIKNNTEAKEYFCRRFQEYEIQAKKDLLSKRECYFIGHYDPSKKWKRRWCPITINFKLAHIEINDDRYFSQYKPLISKCVNTKPGKKLEVFQKSASIILKELGWPEHFIEDKIYADTKEILNTRISKRPW